MRMSPEQLQHAIDRAREYLTEVENGVTAPLSAEDAVMLSKAVLRLDMDRRPPSYAQQQNVRYAGMPSRHRRR